MKTRTIMAAVFAAILIVICGGSAIHYLLDNMPVVFNDPALELAVRTGLGISDRPITRKEAREVVSLDLSLMEGYTKEITDLRGLSAFSNLKKLNLANNMITDISSLSAMKDMRCLYLGNNEIIDITPLQSLVKLTYLSMGGNEISDIESISDMKTLDHLLVSNNRISDISVLQNLPGLEYLDVQGNPIDPGFTLDDVAESCTVIQ